MDNRSSARGRPRGELGLAVARRVADEIQARRLTFTEVARLMADHGRDVGPEAVKRMTTGARSIDVDELAALAAALEVPVVELLLPADGVDGWLLEVEPHRGRFSYVFDQPDMRPPGWMEQTARLMARFAAALGLHPQDTNAPGYERWHETDDDEGDN